MPSYISASQNPVVTEEAVRFNREELSLIYDRVLAKFTGVAQDGTYPIYGAEMGLGVDSEGDGSTASPAERYQIDGKGQLTPADFGLSTSTYEMRDHGVEAFVSDRKADHYLKDLGLDLVQDTANHLMGVALVERERVLASIAFGAGFTSGTTPGTKWGAASADSRGAMDTGKDTIRQARGGNPDQLCVVMGPEVGNAMRKSSELGGYIDTNNIQFDGSQASLERNLAVFWGVKEVLIGNGVYNDGAAGLAFSGSDIWGDFALLAKLAPGQRTTNCALVDFEREAPMVEIHDQPEKRGKLLQIRWDNRIILPDAGFGYLFTAPAS